MRSEKFRINFKVGVGENQPLAARTVVVPIVLLM